MSYDPHCCEKAGVEPAAFPIISGRSNRSNIALRHHSKTYERVTRQKEKAVKLLLYPLSYPAFDGEQDSNLRHAKYFFSTTSFNNV